jgi:hypothetical protein
LGKDDQAVVVAPKDERKAVEERTSPSWKPSSHVVLSAIGGEVRLIFCGCSGPGFSYLQNYSNGDVETDGVPCVSRS